MRRANEAIQRERHPIPTIDEVLLNMNQSTVFSKLDLKWGFHQIELAEESRGITTFTTHCGLYRYKRLMFGITSAPEVYQHIIQQILQGCEGVQNIADNIIVHGPTVEVHDRRLIKVLEVLQKRGLTLNPEKCEFRIPKITFMGHFVSEKGIGPTEEKVRAVVNAREPKTASEVRSFLGLVNFCSRLIPDLATTAEPLRKLTRTTTPFVWGNEQDKAFQELKNKMSTADSLAYFDKDAETLIISDASPVGLGAVLVQKQQNVMKVVAYASRCLSDVERRYSQTEKEALSIYLPGPENIADTLSRLIPVNCESGVNVAEEYVTFIAENAVPNAMSIQEIEKESAVDQVLSVVREAILSGNLKKLPKEYRNVGNELTVLGKLILRGSRLVIPKVLRNRVLDLAHEGHQGIVKTKQRIRSIKTKQRIRSKVWWPRVDCEVERRCKVCHGCQLVSQSPSPEPMKRTVLPKAPWLDVAADLLGPLPGGEYLFVVVDYYSRYFEVDILKSILFSSIIDSLDRMFAMHGIPESMKTDNGPQFVSAQFKDYMRANNVKHVFSTPLWPQGNGEVERQNRTLLKSMKIACATGGDWKKELNKFLMAYRSTPHTVTGVSPAKLMFGREIRTKVPSVMQVFQPKLNVEQRDAMMKEKGKLYGDRRRLAADRNIEIGDTVLVKNSKPKNKLSPAFKDALYKVKDKIGNEVTVESENGVTYRRNSAHVKRYENEEQTSQDEVAVEETDQDETFVEEIESSGRDCEVSPQNGQLSPRPRRQCRPPKRFEYVQNIPFECLKLRRDYPTIKAAAKNAKAVLPKEPDLLVETYLNGKPRERKEDVVSCRHS
ncbi:uncharacterized protein K02A2.6-like [Dendronephthya gigantea]|uniref:uncharacterized protein K02A2.6-like n=1 Tax=Dendronephthya gigantea TaxID=151771 RepID=UPI001069B66A|nr:uncharacterized protein K02A2.6-like [Dendronephthya gigantea]